MLKLTDSKSPSADSIPSISCKHLSTSYMLRSLSPPMQTYQCTCAQIVMSLSTWVFNSNLINPRFLLKGYANYRPWYYFFFLSNIFIISHNGKVSSRYQGIRAFKEINPHLAPSSFHSFVKK